jgi:glucosamine--fructose-6-phosphate aminotransferase (isomerizing)
VGSTIARTVDGGSTCTRDLGCLDQGAHEHGASSLLALHLGRLHDLSHADGQRILRGLQRIRSRSGDPRGRGSDRGVAEDIAKARSAFYIGRVRGSPSRGRAAQKLKEISYIHAEAYQTSELKHGPSR